MIEHTQAKQSRSTLLQPLGWEAGPPCTKGYVTAGHLDCSPKVRNLGDEWERNCAARSVAVQSLITMAETQLAAADVELGKLNAGLHVHLCEGLQLVILLTRNESALDRGTADPLFDLRADFVYAHEC